MYHALLTNRYLTSRVIPLIAVAAVALCVALVIVVVSVMTGFLDMVRSSGRTLMGDVVISYPVSGIPYYDRLIRRIEQLPEAAAATPVVDSWGLLKMPYPDGPEKQTETVQIWGIEPISFAKVTGYEGTLHWKTVEPGDEHWSRLYSDLVRRDWKRLLPLLNDDQKVELIWGVTQLGTNPPPADRAVIRNRLPGMLEDQWRQLFEVARLEPNVLKKAITEEQWTKFLSGDDRLLKAGQIYQDGLSLQRGGQPGIALGIHVSEANERRRDGSYGQMGGGYWWMPRFSATLITIPISGGTIAADSAESRILPIVNEFQSGVFLIDDKRVMVPLDTAQKMLHLNQGELTGADDKVIGIDPAKATLVLVRAREGVTPEALREAVEGAYNAFWEEIADDNMAAVKAPAVGLGLSVRTWAQQQAQFIGPVEKERELMRTLFSIVYLVCAALVLSIFWAIVYEKTRDIGILRSVGASRGGIVWIFLRYGLVVGVIGSIVGLGLAYLVVHNINTIHGALAEPPMALAFAVLALAAAAVVITIALSRRGGLLPLVVGTIGSLVLIGLGAGIWALHSAGGVVIWDPAVYYFTTIPNSMDMATAATTMIGAVVFSLLGAVVPAAKAADTDPVKALRYE